MRTLRTNRLSSSFFPPSRKTSNIARCLLLFSIFHCLFGGQLAALDPTRHISQYGHSAWRVQDGFLNAGVYRITQTADGYLWIGTQNGLVRFDGVRFVPWVPPAGQSLPSSIITSLLGARDGSLWIGTTSGLSHWVNQNLINVGAHGQVTHIREDRNGAIWFNVYYPSVPEPLCQIVGAGTRCYGKAEGVPDNPTGLAEDSQGNLWLGGASSVVRWKPNSHTAYTTAGFRSNETQAGVIDLVANPDGSIWVGMTFSGPGSKLQQLVQGVWKPFQSPQFAGAGLPISALFLDRQGTLWVGAYSQGIYRIRDGKVEHFRSTDGLSDDFVQNFYEDREGNLWVATDKGIDLFHDVRVATFAPNQGLDVGEVDSVLTTRDGTVWIGSDSALEALGGDKVSSVRTGSGLPGTQVTSLFEDHLGRFWVGIDETLSIYKNGRFVQVKRHDGSPVGWVYAITEDVDNNIWAETRRKGARSLLRIRDFKVIEEFPAPQMPAARSVAPDHEGGIWLGLMNGDLARVRQGRPETFHFEHSQDSRVEQVTVSPDGSVLGATAFGLIGWKNGKRQILAARNGLPCDWVHAFLPDGRGALWLYMQCGLVEISDAEMQNWWQHPDSLLQPRVFDVFDGVRPGRGSPFAAAGSTPDGRLWFGHGDVLQVFDPSHLATNMLPPPVHVEEIVADRKAYSPQEGLQIPPLTRDLEIDYTALSFAIPQKVRFRYKLEERDTTWQEPGTRRQAFYSDLHPGKYHFRVIACNNDGLWNEEGATLDFSVAAAWYQTNWFRASCVVVFLVLLWGIYRLRVQQLQHQFATGLEARVNERTRIARELHDTLLQSFQGLILRFQAATNLLPERPVEAKQRFESAIDQAAQAITEGRDAVQGLRSSTVETNDLAMAISALGEELAADGTIADSALFRMAVEGTPRNLHPILRDEVYRIAGETLRNAFRHARARQVEVEIHYDARQFRLRVRDDGKGIDPEILGEHPRPGHFGLHGMRERAKIVGGQLDVWSELDSGTEVELSIPASRAYATPSTRRSWWSGKGSEIKS
jgi:signal transduction histidine kinase/ligand-binding sensor domain-containing protein